MKINLDSNENNSINENSIDEYPKLTRTINELRKEKKHFEFHSLNKNENNSDGEIINQSSSSSSILVCFILIKNFFLFFI